MEITTDAAAKLTPVRSGLKTLVVVLCETREGERTQASLERFVLKPLNADLALCVASEQAGHFAYEELQPIAWLHPEPDNWAEAFDELFPGSNWRELLNTDWARRAGEGFHLLGGPREPRLSGSGGIIMWYRCQLARHLRTESMLDAYDWFAIIRSDFLWEVPLPPVNRLDPNSVYVLDGEAYGGVSDRFILFSREVAEEVLGLGEDLFCRDSVALARMKNFIDACHQLPNPESYLADQMHRRGIWNRLVRIPYPAWAIRSEGTATRWSRGRWEQRLGVSVKYRNELLAAVLNWLLRLHPEEILDPSVTLGFRIRRRLVRRIISMRRNSPFRRLTTRVLVLVRAWVRGPVK
jgi:hypothetical protein